jgi:hypothetical protein
LIKEGSGSATKVGGIGGDDRLTLSGLVVLPSRWSTGDAADFFCVYRLRHGRVEVKGLGESLRHAREAIAMLRMTLPPAGAVLLAAGGRDMVATRVISATSPLPDI